MEQVENRYNFEGIPADDLKTAINHNKFGGVLLQAGNLEKALQHFQKALNFVKSKHIFTNVYQNIGNLYAQQNKIEDAISYYKLVIEHSPHNAENKPKIKNPLLYQKVLNSREAYVDAYTNLGN